MIHKVFAIYDQAAAAYLPPFILPKRDMALRTFQQCVNSTDHQFAASPSDYTLFELGTFDDETAKFVPTDPGPHVVANGLVLVASTDGHAKEGDPNADQVDAPQVGNGASVQPSSTGSDTPE